MGIKLNLFRAALHLPVSEEVRTWLVSRQRDALEQVFERDILAARDPETKRSLRDQCRYELSEFDLDEDWLHSDQLLREARRKHVDPPKMTEEFWTSRSPFDNGGPLYLNDAGCTELRKRLREEDKGRWEGTTRWVAPLAALAAAAGALTAGWKVFGPNAARTPAEPPQTWSAAPRPQPDPIVFHPQLSGGSTVTFTSPVDGGVRADIRDVQPSGDGHMVLENLNVGGFGGSVNIAAGDNGTASTTLDHVNVAGGSGPHGGDVTIRAGKGGPNGPGGNLIVKGGSVKGGAAK